MDVTRGFRWLKEEGEDWGVLVKEYYNTLR
jgi:hypothetical protein